MEKLNTRASCKEMDPSLLFIIKARINLLGVGVMLRNLERRWLKLWWEDLVRYIHAKLLLSAFLASENLLGKEAEMEEDRG